jgi:glucuronoarabinoxylan endo-1,4-beta-xylanase
MMGNYSKFVRPGWNRIGATSAPVTGVAVSAFKNKTTGAFAIVVLNNNTSAVSQQFSLRGVTAKTLTPWVTSSALDLAQQSAITTAAGDSFTYTLPASSITTLVGASGT